MTRPTATWMRTSESSWPVWSPRFGVRPRPRRQPARVGEPRGTPYATNCTVPLLPPAGSLGSGATGQEQRSLAAGHCPETGYVARRSRKVRQSEEPAHQTTQRQGTGQGRGPGRSPNRRRLTRVTFSLFKRGDIVAGQQHILQIPGRKSLIIHNGCDSAVFGDDDWICEILGSLRRNQN